MGLCCPKQTREEPVHPSFTTGPITANSHLITEQPRSRIVRSQDSGPISNGLRPISPNGLPPAICPELQCNFNDSTRAVSVAPRILPGPKVLIRNRGLVQALLEQLEVPYRDCFPYNEPVSLELVSKGSPCYDFVMAKFWNQKFNSNYTIVDIKRVWNPYLMVQYLLMQKKEKNNLVEKYLFHGTSHDALSGVLNHNFNWRKAVAGKWGWGVSFANNPWYSSHYSKKKQSKNWPFVMMLVKVLVEYGAIREGNSFTTVPTIGYSTTNPTKEVIVKYDDATFYPEYIVYFRNKMYF